MNETEFNELKRKAGLWDAINLLWSFPGKTLEDVLEMRAKELRAVAGVSQDERTRQFIAETAKDPTQARAFLQDAGILDEGGGLAEPYRPT